MEVMQIKFLKVEGKTSLSVEKLAVNK